jgi:hypothetical protein
MSSSPEKKGKLGFYFLNKLVHPYMLQVDKIALKLNKSIVMFCKKCYYDCIAIGIETIV